MSKKKQLDKVDRKLTWEEFEERIDTIYEDILQLINDTYGQK